MHVRFKPINNPCAERKNNTKIELMYDAVKLDSLEIKTCKLKIKNKDFFGKNNIYANAELICLFSAKPPEEIFLVA